MLAGRQPPVLAGSQPPALACMTLMGSTCGLRISISRLHGKVWVRSTLSKLQLHIPTCHPHPWTQNTL